MKYIVEQTLIGVISIATIISYSNYCALNILTILISKVQNAAKRINK